MLRCKSKYYQKNKKGDSIKMKDKGCKKRKYISWLNESDSDSDKDSSSEDSDIDNASSS